MSDPVPDSATVGAPMVVDHTVEDPTIANVVPVGVTVAVDSIASADGPAPMASITAPTDCDGVHARVAEVICTPAASADGAVERAVTAYTGAAVGDAVVTVPLMGRSTGPMPTTPVPVSVPVNAPVVEVAASCSDCPTDGPEELAVSTAAGCGVAVNPIVVDPVHPDSATMGVVAAASDPLGTPIDEVDTNGVSTPPGASATVPSDQFDGTDTLAAENETPAMVNCPVADPSATPPGNVAPAPLNATVVSAVHVDVDTVPLGIVTCTPAPVNVAARPAWSAVTASQNATGNCPGGSAEMITGIDTVVTRSNESVTVNVAVPFAAASPAVNDSVDASVTVPAGRSRSAVDHAYV